MANRHLRLILAAALLWTGSNICLMPQAECEGQARPPCHCHHHSRQKCCTGVHLVEAGVQSGVTVTASAPLQAVLAQPEPAAESGEVCASLSIFVPAVALHPPPRACLGRSPPAA